MLEHGIKEMDKEKLWLPSAAAERPDQARLESRFQEFVNQKSCLYFHKIRHRIQSRVFSVLPHGGACM